MPMCQDRRGEFKDMQYLDTYLVEMHYEMPLNEIIYDFFRHAQGQHQGLRLARLRALRLPPERTRQGRYPAQRRSGGRAVVHRAPRQGLRPRGKLCEKLKDNIPPPALLKFLFRRPSAGASSRARPSGPCARTFWPSATAAISAERRNCSKSRRRAKKKMRSLGTVQVPTEAFLAVLKLDE